jgi:hypothetical protein
MRPERALRRALWGLGVALGLCLPPAALAQATSPQAGVSYASPPAQAAGDSDTDRPAPRRRAARRAEVRPYLEVDQVVTADLNGGDTLTYTTLAAGVDGRVTTRRVTAQMSYRYERRIAWDGDVADQDVHSGIALVGVEAIPGALNLEAGALAARTGGEGRLLTPTDRDGATQVYAVYGGPSLSTRAGPMTVNASYRLGYVAVDADDGLAGTGRDYDKGVAHSASVSVGMAPGRLPVGWTVGAGYAREEFGRFDNRFEGAYVRGDVVVPVSHSLALTAGVGYETIEASQQDFARDQNGAPIVGPDGRLAPDPTRPRLLTYDIDGIMYDAGIIWRPTNRTELQARAGRRYGGTTVVGSLEHRFNGSYGMRAVVYDGIDTFGRMTVNNISSLPSGFEINPNPLIGGLPIAGCIFGEDPGSGVCFDQSLQSISGQAFRHRGAGILLSGTSRRWDFGLGAGYAHRRYGQPDNADPLLFDRRTDEGVSLFANLGRDLGRTSAIGFDAYASWFDSDRPDFDGVFSTGITGTYRRSFLLQRLQFLAALGLYHTDAGTADSTIASGLVGLRYTF